jgi:hypothetical protein
MDPFSWISQHSIDGGQVRCATPPHPQLKLQPETNLMHDVLH